MYRSPFEAGKPVVVAVRAGRRYRGCGCGRSSDAPFCDRDDTDPGCRASTLDAVRDEVLWFCGCGRSHVAPLCDGSHKRAIATVRPA
jgi:CDGSH-type Zn-finger protein